MEKGRRLSRESAFAALRAEERFRGSGGATRYANEDFPAGLPRVRPASPPRLPGPYIGRLNDEQSRDVDALRRVMHLMETRARACRRCARSDATRKLTPRAR
jgi:hypothetical protein